MTMANPTQKKERGIALVFVLLMMVIAISAALFSARLTLLGDKASRNQRDREVAFQAAELALNDAELDIMDAGLVSTVANARACKIGKTDSGLAIPPPPGCSSTSDARGLCQSKSSQTVPFYQQIDWEETDDSKRVYVKFGEFTGRAGQLATGEDNPPANAPAPARPPKYIIVKAESLPSLRLKPEVEDTIDHGGYKIYALGYGVDKNTKILLESEIYKPNMEKSCPN